MASTQAKQNDDLSKQTKTATKVEKKTEKGDEMTRQDYLVAELSKYYGVEFDDDIEHFVKACNKTALRRTKSPPDAPVDPQKEARMSGLLGELRQMWENDIEKKGETKEQKAIRKALDNSDYVVSISFPDENTWVMRAGGNEDSGNMDIPQNVIIERAQKLADPEHLG